MIVSGAVHPYLIPLSTVSSSSVSSISSSLAFTVFNSINLNHRLSFVHYNVQRIASKLDILHAELVEFDILAFTETCLSSSVLESYSKPERKDYFWRCIWSWYMLRNIYTTQTRSRTRSVYGFGCLWIEIANNTKHALFGVYYRAPNPDSINNTSIEDSLHLAIDTVVNDIIVTGDFNFGLLNQRTIRKIDSLCNQCACF